MSERQSVRVKVRVVEGGSHRRGKSWRLRDFQREFKGHRVPNWHMLAALSALAAGTKTQAEVEQAALTAGAFRTPAALGSHCQEPLGALQGPLRGIQRFMYVCMYSIHIGSHIPACTGMYVCIYVHLNT